MSELSTRPATPADRPAWDAFVEARPEADVLQAWAWGDAVERAGYRPGSRSAERAARILATTADGEVRGVAQVLIRPTQLGRTVAYAPHGPVWDRDAADASQILGALVGSLVDLARSTRGIGLKVDPRQALLPEGVDPSAVDPSVGDPAAALQALGFRPSRFDLQASTTRIVDLSGTEEARVASWSSDARNRSKRALREGSTTEVFRTPDPGPMNAFGALLGRTAAHGGFKARDGAFLADVAGEFAGKGRFYLALTTWQGRAIAGTYVVGLADRAYYLYGATDRDVPRHTYGPYAAMAAMQAALAADGIRSLDVWGVAEPGDPDADQAWAGFSEFKIRFGGTPVRHPGTFDLAIDPFWWWVRGIREQLRRSP